MPKKSGFGLRHFAVEFRYDDRISRGSAVIASRSYASSAEASRAHIPSSARRTKRRLRIVIGTIDPRVLALVDHNRDPVTERALQMAGVLAGLEGRAPTDLPALAAKLWPEMRIAELVIGDALRAVDRRLPLGSPRSRALAMQLVMGATHDAGIALCGTTRWPRPWVYEAAFERPSRSGRPTLQHQYDLLTYRAQHGRWPKASDPVARRAAVRRLRKQTGTLTTPRRRSSGKGGPHHSPA